MARRDVTGEVWTWRGLAKMDGIIFLLTSLSSFPFQQQQHKPNPPLQIL